MNLFTPEKQLQFVQEELQAWIREDVDPQLRAAIRKRQKHIPEETIGNLDHNIYTDIGGALAGYSLSFQDSARHVDMRRLTWDSRPVSQNKNFILEWAKRRGARSFRKGVPSYSKEGAKRLTEDQKLERIAGAIIAAKGKNKTKYKRRGRWYNQLMGRLTSRLVARISRNQAEWLARATKAELEGAFTQ